MALLKGREMVYGTLENIKKSYDFQQNQRNQVNQISQMNQRIQVN